MTQDLAPTFSHGMRPSDDLIGCTAIDYCLTLLSANVKHFSAVSVLKLEGSLP